jgi:acetyl esterase/lipase
MYAWGKFSAKETGMRIARTCVWSIAAGIVIAASAFAQQAEPRVIKDVEYARAGDTSLRLDLYLPEGQGPHPLIVWIHGGAFRSGDKGGIFWSPMPRQTERGYAVASINYRLSGQAIFPALVYDCKAAIRWLRANAGKYGLNAQRIVVAGESAGGHLSALLGTSGGVSELEDLTMGNPSESSRVQGVVDFFGPTDFLQMDPGIPASCQKSLVHNVPESPESLLLGCTITSCPEKVKAANPIAYVGKDDPPFLILHGTADCSVAPAESQLLFDALLKAGVRASLHLLPGLAHGDRRFVTPENEKLVNDFIDGVLKP